MGEVQLPPGYRLLWTGQYEFQLRARERFKILRQLRVYTAQGRLTMAILMALPPGLLCMLWFVNRDFLMPLFHDPIGHMFIAMAIVMQTIGFFIIRKIIHIKV